MFKFLFGGKAGLAKAESQRAIIERAMGEVNAVLATMPDKPKVAVDLTSGQIELTLPDQTPDEALALPAPKEDPKVDPEAAEADKAA